MFSIVIPIFNEAENIKLLVDEIEATLYNFENYEIVFVNDCSTDNTLTIINSFKNNKIKLLSNIKNEGQSYSMHKGIEASIHDIIITIDGDGQNNPSDIPMLLNNYLENIEYKLVGGIRKKRQDSFLKKISSKIANKIRSNILKDNCPDTGCSLKVFDKYIFLEFPYFDGIHRFLPALFLGFGHKTNFMDVDHRKRKYGISKYGTMNRLFKGISDIIKVRKIINKNKI